MAGGPRYTVGIDFGTASARAVVVDVADGREVGVAVHPYANGVIDERLPAPDDDVVLGPDWALQDPADYVEALRRAVPAAVADAGVDPADVIGVGIDFTSCTMLPTTADGTPLCQVDAYRRDPHAWVKLWKHHAAQPEADEINRVAAELGEPWLARYGGRISSEWFFPKALQILRESPGTYEAAGRLIEAADWIVWQLTGVETRNSCTAGYKALWSADDGFPDAAFFAALDPRFERIVDGKMSRTIARLGEAAGTLSAEAAAWTGLRAGIAGRGRQRGRPRLRAGGVGDRARDAGRDHGHQHLPRRAVRDRPGDRRDVRRRRATASSAAGSATRRARRRWATCSAGSPRPACRPATTTGPGRRASTSTRSSRPRRPTCGPASRA